MREHRHLRPDRDGQRIDRALPLAAARDLARIYSDVLRDPLPPDLVWLIERLEQRATEGEEGSSLGQHVDGARLAHSC